MSTDVASRFGMTRLHMTVWPGDLDVPPVVAAPRLWGMAFGTAVHDDRDLEQAVVTRLVGTSHVVSLPTDTGSPGELAAALQSYGDLLFASDATSDDAPDDEADDTGPYAHLSYEEILALLTERGLVSTLNNDRAAFYTLEDFPLRSDQPLPGPDEDGTHPVALVIDFAQLNLMEVPEELWLRDFIDLTDGESDAIPRLLAFLATFGPVEPPARLTRYSGSLAMSTALRALPDSDGVPAPLADFGLTSEQIRQHVNELDALIADWQEAYHHDTGPVLDLTLPWWARPDGAHGQVSLSRTSVGLQVEVICLYRAVFRTWVYLSEHMPFTATFLADDIDPGIAEIWAFEDLPVPQTNMAVVESCLAVVNAMVADFGPRVQLMREGSRTPLDMNYPRIRTLLGLQVLQWLASGESVQRCQNETCGRYYLRHQGRSQHGAKRSRGVLYCSADCAQAQASRAYRQRKREQSPS